MEIEVLLASLSPNPHSLCIQEFDEKTYEELHCMTTKEENQEGKYYIEAWFQEFIRPHRSILQQLLAPSPSKSLVPHVLISLNVYFSNLNMNTIIIMLHTWLHWKYSYT
jgi:hypothetical protein